MSGKGGGRCDGVFPNSIMTQLPVHDCYQVGTFAVPMHMSGLP
jgi:hypothetical protein